MSAICDAHKKAGVELLYNSVKTGSQLVSRPDQLENRRVWRQDVVEKASTQQREPSGPRLKVWRLDQLEIRYRNIEEHVQERLGPQAPSWAAQENGKEAWLWLIEWGSICCSSVRSPTPSYTQTFEIKWEVYFSKNCVARLHCVVVFCMHM